MHKYTFIFLVFISVVILSDFYFYHATKSLIVNWRFAKLIKVSFWSTTVLILGTFAYGYWMVLNGTPLPSKFRLFVQGLVICMFVPRILAMSVFALDDIIRLGKWIYAQFTSSSVNETNTSGISRSKFLQLTGLGIFGVFFSALTYGVFKGAYNYNVIKQKLKISNLPDAFKGLKIIQISDLHVGSFFSTEPLERAVEMINALEADLIFFTGDLVNEISEEAIPYIPVLSKMKAKEGVYSILGNHDYGDYYYKVDNPEIISQKKHNKDLMKSIHKDSGFRLLLDENVTLNRGGEMISIVGVENWGAKAKFPQYGKLDKAMEGTEGSAVKLLLSHDPSHWEAQVQKDHPEIDVTFSGHTHGMQFGIEIPGFKWSPVKYLYKQWAGLYSEGKQQLYVNRGLGFVGYPGRVGISPEITLFELDSDA